MSSYLCNHYFDAFTEKEANMSHRLQIQYRELERRAKQIKELQEELENMKSKLQNTDEALKSEKDKNDEVLILNIELQKQLNEEKKKTNEMKTIIISKALEMNTEKHRNKYLKRKNKKLVLALNKEKYMNLQLIKSKEVTMKEPLNSRKRKAHNDEEIGKKIKMEWKLDGNDEIFIENQSEQYGMM